MPSVNIFQSDNPEGPANESMRRYELQQKRTDFEALLLEDFYKKSSQEKSLENKKQLIKEYCEKLGGITIQQFIHKLEIFYGSIDDDESEWREKKYGKQ
jgi:hypothetical protein